MEKVRMIIDCHGGEKPTVVGTKINYMDIVMVVHPTIRANQDSQLQQIDGSYTVSEYSTGRSIVCAALQETAIETAIDLISGQYELVLEQISTLPKLNA